MQAYIFESKKATYTILAPSLEAAQEKLKECGDTTDLTFTHERPLEEHELEYKDFTEPVVSSTQLRLSKGTVMVTPVSPSELFGD